MNKLSRRDVARHLQLALGEQDESKFRDQVELLYKLLVKKPPKFVSSRPTFKLNSSSEVVVELNRRDAKRVEEIFYEFLDRKKTLSELEGEWYAMSLKPRRITPALFSFTFRRKVNVILDSEPAQNGRQEKPTVKVATPASVERTFDSLDASAQQAFLDNLMKKHGLK